MIADNKIFRILSKLSKTEFKQFMVYAATGLVYQDRHTKRLLQIIEKEYPSFDDQRTSGQFIYHFIYPDEKGYNDAQMRRLFSQVTGTLEDYLAWHALTKKEKLPLLKRTYKEKGLDQYYNQLLTAETKLLNGLAHRDAEYHLDLYKLSDEQYQYHSGKENRSIDLDPQALLNNLELYYLASRLRISCELVNRGNVLKTTNQLNGINEILAQSADADYNRYPAIAVYRNILLTLTEPDDALHYQHLKEILPTVDKVFSPRELRDIYALAQNYCIRKINNGQTDYLGELFELYKALLQNQLLLEGGYLSQWHYKNIVYVALRIGDFAWCKQFIEVYAASLDPAEKENAYAYNMAYYHFYAKEYSKVLKLLGRIEFTDVFYFLDTRSLLLKSFYELDEIDPMLSLLDTFQSALKRNKLISENQKMIYLNLVKVVRKLSGINSRDKDAIKRLTKMVEDNKQIADRAWIMSKLNTLNENQRYATSN